MGEVVAAGCRKRLGLGRSGEERECAPGGQVLTFCSVMLLHLGCTHRRMGFQTIIVNGLFGIFGCQDYRPEIPEINSGI
jgi:hypothetical protein